jgi:hypothetical protein
MNPTALNYQDLTWRPTDQLLLAGLEFEFHPRNNNDTAMVPIILEALWERFPNVELLTYELQGRFPLVPQMYLTYQILLEEGLIGGVL